MDDIPLEEMPEGNRVEIVDEMAEDALMTRSASGESCISGSKGSDTESWTIIDREEDGEEGVTLVAQQEGASFAKAAAADDEKEGPQCDSDSDIETLEVVDNKPVGGDAPCRPAQTEAELNADSLNSDGIPFSDSPSGKTGNEQWFWDDESSITKRSGPCSEYGELSSMYPSSELPTEFPSIEKGHTYSHKPNRQLNTLLNTSLVVGMLLVAGFGVGHFLGWSEKLEVQEQYAEEREEKLEELTDSLVTCITGEEGNGGDDQDLEEKVIRQLSEENAKLKLALGGMKYCVGQPSADPELPIITRQRLNDLLVANADLEKEVARLRYSHSAMIAAASTKNELVISQSDLLNAKNSLNAVREENEQLKIEIGKARYGPSFNKARQEGTMAENNTTESLVEDEEAAETPQPVPDTGRPKTVIDYVKDIGSSLRSSSSKIWNDAREGKFVGGDKVKDLLTKIKVSYDSVVSEGWESDNLVRRFDEKVDEVLRSIPRNVAPAGKKIVSGAKTVARKLEEGLEAGISEATKFLESQLGENPSRWKERQLQKLQRGLSSFMNELYFHDHDEEPVVRNKGEQEGKEAKNGPFGERERKWEKEKTNVDKERVVSPRNEANGRTNMGNEEDAAAQRTTKGKDRKNENGNRRGKKNEGKAEKRNWKKEGRKNDLDDEIEWRRGKTEKASGGTEWSQEEPERKRKRQENISEHDWKKLQRRKRKAEKKERRLFNEGQTVRRHGGHMKEAKSRNWLFARAQGREHQRKEERRGDWLFDRANDRKKFHRLVDSEWYEKNVNSKDCYEDEKGNSVCVNLQERNPAAINQGTGAKQAKGDHLAFKDRVRGQLHDDFNDDDFEDDFDDDDFVYDFWKEAYYQDSRTTDGPVTYYQYIGGKK